MKLFGYDERQYEACNVALKNKVATMDFSGVGLALPSGTVQLKTDVYITHLRFEMHGVEWVVKVTDRRCLGDTLFSFNYTIDYLKDYWLKYSGNIGHYNVYRTTNDNITRPLIPDSRFGFTGRVTYENITGNAVGGSDVLAVFAGTSGNSPTAYRLSWLQWLSVQLEMVKNRDLYNACVGVYMFPFRGNISGASADTSASIAYYRNVDEDLQSYNFNMEIAGFSFGDIAYVFDPSYNSDGAYIDVNTGINIPRPVSFVENTATKYRLYIPYIGSVDINPMQTNGSITVRYYIDFYNGTISAALNGNKATQSPAIALPTIPLAGSTAQQIVNNIDGKSNNTIIAGIVGLVAAAAATVFTQGTALPVAAGIGSTAASAVSIYQQQAVDKPNALIGSISYSSSNGAQGAWQNRFILSKAVPGVCMTREEHGNVYGNIAQRYYDTLADLPRGYYYWVDFSNAVIYGGAEYAEEVRRVYDNKRILV